MEITSANEYEFGTTITAEVIDLRNRDVARAKILDAASTRFKVLDVGCGFKPALLSIDLQEKDLWIGVDPALGYDPGQSVKRGSRAVHTSSIRFLVPAEADALPPIGVDLIMMIAPNPKNIVEGMLEEIEKQVKIGTQIYVLLDKRTQEAKMYGSLAASKIRIFLKTNGFVPVDDLNIGDRSIDASTSQDAIGGTVFKAIKRR